QQALQALVHPGQAAVEGGGHGDGCYIVILLYCCWGDQDREFVTFLVFRFYGFVVLRPDAYRNLAESNGRFLH
ncbi:MAG: hypothetical protein KDD10_28560, partial [Phaeodactylibacter sp.]|nr:hypothetical protein [Phaeodactylibacter sp.]